MKEYHTKDGEWAEVHTYAGCCDCGLVHRWEFRWRKGKLECRATRMPRLTLQARRKMWGKNWGKRRAKKTTTGIS